MDEVIKDGMMVFDMIENMPLNNKVKYRICYCMMVFNMIERMFLNNKVKYRIGLDSPQLMGQL